MCAVTAAPGSGVLAEYSTAVKRRIDLQLSWFCQLVKADIVTRQTGTLLRSSLSLRQPAPCPSSQPNSQIGSALLGNTPTWTATGVSVGSVGRWGRGQRGNAGYDREM